MTHIPEDQKKYGPELPEAELLSSPTERSKDEYFVELEETERLAEPVRELEAKKARDEYFGDIGRPAIQRIDFYTQEFGTRLKSRAHSATPLRVEKIDQR